MYKMIFILVTIGLLFGCTANPQDLQTGSQIQPQVNDSKVADNVVKLTMQEVAKHNSASDCWLVIDGKVISVPQEFAQTHANGMVVPLCGTDASAIFNAKHDQQARQQLVKMTIGPLE